MIVVQFSGLCQFSVRIEVITAIEVNKSLNILFAIEGTILVCCRFTIVFIQLGYVLAIECRFLLKCF